MQNTLKFNHYVNYSEVDSKAKQRFDSIVSQFQKATAFHSREMGVDGETTAKKSNAYWVLSKLRFKILSYPNLYDHEEVETYPTTVSAVKFMRDYVISHNGKNLVVGRGEWCTLDIDTHAIRRTSSICYPHSLVHRTDDNGAGDFIRVKEMFTEQDFSQVHIPQFVDIDSNGHTNNVAYVRMALNCFSPEEFANANLNEFEISFSRQSFYGDQIRLYKKQVDNKFFIEGRVDEKVIFNAIFINN